MRRPRPAPFLGVLLLLGALGLAAAEADGGYLRGEPLPQDGTLLDLILRTSDDPDLLTGRQAQLRQRLLDMGVDPRGGWTAPSISTLLQRRFATRADWYPELGARQVEILEVDWEHQKVFVYRFPESTLFFTDVDTNLIGIAFEPPRDMADSTLTIQMDEAEAWYRHWVSIGLQDRWRQQIRNRTGQQDGNRQLLNFTIPIKLPRTLERIIGRGDATNIRISGTETISIGGSSTVRSDFVPNEIQQSQSLFPTLEMKQTLRVNLDGTVGEKIKVRVSHDSERIGSESTEVKLGFEGDEDDIIRTIRAGNIDVTLPGSRLLGVGASKGGLFGVKVEGALGPLEFTLLTSKEQSQSNEQSFSQQGGSADEFVIPSTDYAKGRFFRLNAPFSFFFPSDTDPLGALHDNSFVPFLPIADGGQGWRIDITTLEIFLAVGPGISDENTVDAGVAFRDSTGIGWESVQGGVASLDEVALTALLADPRKPFQRRERWRRLIKDTDWQPLFGGNEQLIGVAMSRSYGDNEALGCAYNILDAEGNIVRKVGRILNDSGGPTIRDFAPGADPTAQIYFFKLLKPAQAPDPFDKVSGIFDVLALTWEYEFRNFYDLRGRGIDPSSFELTIERNDTSLDLPQLVPGTSPALRWIRVFGIDELDQSGNPGSDDEADITNAQIFRLDAGFMQFPVTTPFDPSPSEVSFFTGGTLDSLQQNIRARPLYQRRLIGTETNDLSYFNLVVKQSSVSSRLRLNAFNIKEGSEEVTLDGRVLQRNVDYTIDYFSGEVNLQGEALGALNAQSNIGVKFEVDPLFGGGRTSLNGLNLTYRLGQQNTLSTTWLLQSQPNSSTKPRLGEEPSKNWVGNVSAKLKFTPDWVRTAANWLPRVDSEQEVQTNLDAEVAVSVPNPNTRNEAYLEDFESVDQSNNVSLSREGWWWASLPAEYDSLSSTRIYGPEDRAYAGWHRPVPGVKREQLNPTLSEQERRDVLPSLELRVLSTQPELGWQGNEYAGIMRSLGELDLTQTQFLEFWLDDATGFVPDDMLETGRPGRLHFDFGFVNEDFFWKKDAQGQFVTGVWDLEDLDNDGSQQVNKGEDDGLDNKPSSQETAADVLIPGRPVSASDPAGDDFSAEAGEGNVFFSINGTEDNQRLDSEDIDRDNFHDLQDGYYTLTLELSDLDQAIVDIYRDYAEFGSFIDQAMEDNLSWRKYRLDLRDLEARIARSDGTPYSAATPDLSRVRTLRIWYEAETGTLADRRIKFAEMRFLGNRWLNDQVRGVDDEVIPIAERGLQEFRLGVVNNKENPEYVPPIFPDTRNNVAEKEQSLQFLYGDLEPGSRVRARKDIPGRGGQDYLVYDELNFFWRAPYEDGIEATEQRALEGFFWIGTDSLNYYEIAVPFDQVVTTGDGWQECRIDLGEMTQVKDDPDSLRFVVPGDSTSARIKVRNLADKLTGEQYRIEVRGRPDLRRVQRFYAGVRYPSDDPENDPRPPYTGEVLFNEIRLKNVNDEVGYAQRYALNTSIPGLGDVQVDWSQTDEEFRGLNKDVGSGVLQRSWSARTSSNLKNLLPTFGLDIPFSLSQREKLDLPKYRALSDVELFDDETRRAEKSFDIARSFNFQVRKSQPSQSRWLQYSIDRFSFSWSGTRSERIGPTRDAKQVSADRKFNYDLRIRQGWSLKIPFMRERIRFVPNQLTMASTWRWDLQESVEKQRTDSGIVLIPREPKYTKTNVNNATLTFQPLRTMRGSFALSSNRNILLDTPGDPTTLFGLFQIGKEEVFQQRLSYSWKSELKLLKWLKPDFEYNSAYQENRRPGIRQRASNADLSITGDGFLGRPGEVRHLSTNGDISLRGQVNLTGWLKKRFGEQRQAPRQDPEELRRQEQRERGSISRRRGDELEDVSPTLPTPVPGAAEPDTTGTGGESQEPEDPFGEDLFGESEEDTGVDPADQEAEGEQEPGEEDPAATFERLQEEAERQRQERQLEAERLRQEREQAAKEEGGPGEGEAPGEGDETAPAEEEEEEFAPGEALGSLFRPFKNLVLNLQPVNSSWQRQQQTNYQHVNGRADWLYRLGIASKPDEAAIGRVPLTGGGAVDDLYSNESRQWTDRYTLSTQSQMTETIRFDTNFAYREIRREGSRGDSEDRTLDFPNVNLRISRVHEWRLFGDLFSTSNMDFNFKRSKSVRNVVEGQKEFPKVTLTLQPRWTFRFQNGLDTNLNITWSRDRSSNSINEIKGNQIRGNLKLQKNFDADGALSFLRFGRRGTGTTIDMNVDISYTRDRNERFNTTTNRSDQQRGSDRYSVLPNFSYQFSRNLRAGLRLEFSRTKDIARDATTTTVGLGLDATLNF